MKHAVLVELERVFGVLNSRLFAGKLKKPNFVLQPKKKLVMRFVPGSYQILVGCDIVQVAAEAVLTCLLHEMARVGNYAKGVVDCRANQYHKKEFMRAALQAGLFCTRHKTKGWVTSATTGELAPSKEVIEVRRRAFEEVKLDLTGWSDLVKRERSTVYFLKYECKCPLPHNSIRSGRRPDGEHPLHIRCVNCDAEFVCVDF